MNYCMRGCYSAVARFKHGFRRAEHELLRAEARVDWERALATGHAAAYERIRSDR